MQEVQVFDSRLPTVAIVGAGHAGGELATGLRQEGWAGRIVLIGEEPHLPYQRPPLSKGFLGGEMAVDSLFLKPAATYEKAGVEFMSACRVEAIDRPARKLRFADGRELAYDKLALTTGGRPRPLKVAGGDQAQRMPNYHMVRTLDDILRLRPQFEAGLRLVIIGGGYIGLEVAATAVKRGLKVTVLEALPRVLARVTAPEMSAFYEQVHRDAGVDLQTGVQVSGFEFEASGDAVGAVLCGDDHRVPADLVVVGVGQLPNTELAAAAGLAVDNGILIDECCLTADPDIVAAGDCANQPNAYAGRRLRLESVPNAMEQARAAAAALCGKPRPCRVVPWFWSDQYDLKLQMAGLSAGYDRVVVRGKPEARAFATFYLKDGVVIAVDAVNRQPEFMIARRMVSERLTPDPEQLADASVNLKSLLT
jgi:3-phenylpropionate/trans-cinnamate dioxygenase ferredoxin reductase subunit